VAPHQKHTGFTDEGWLAFLWIAGVLWIKPVCLIQELRLSSTIIDAVKAKR